MITFLSRCTVLLKQTTHPPRFVKPLALNPLTRWSSKLPSWPLTQLEWQQQEEQELSSESETENCRAKSSVSVGLEGCQCGFNATNAIRTCSYFATTYPPIFMSASSWSDIAHLQRREDDNQENNKECDATLSDSVIIESAKMTDNICKHKIDTNCSNCSCLYTEIAKENTHCNKSNFDGNCYNDHAINNSNGKDNNKKNNIRESLLALFSRETFFNKINVQGSIIVLENFTDRSVNIFTSRVPSDARIVIGHENNGVSKELIDQEESKTDSNTAPSTIGKENTTFVVYIPQYGTISSLNVVTTLGIALFYVYLDCHYPDSRTLVTCHKSHTNQKPHSSKSQTQMMNTRTHWSSEQSEAVFSNNNSNTVNNAIDICMEESGREDCERRRLRSKLQDYQHFFESKLPMLINTNTTNNNSNNNSSGRNWDNTRLGAKERQAESNTVWSHFVEERRIDKRPIHPTYYCKTSEEISSAHQAYRSDLLKYSKLCSSSFEKELASISTLANTLSESEQPEGITIRRDNKRIERFGISVFYENEYDQRNFGGLIRCANAFLVDHVMYVGRRKYNVVGSLGCYHYTPPVYVDVDYQNSTSGKEVLREYVEKLSGANCQWWFLDCGQEVLYHDKSQSAQDKAYYSSAESWRWYDEHVLAQISENDNNSDNNSTHITKSNTCEIISLCDKEHDILNAARYVVSTNTNNTTNCDKHNVAACKKSNSCNDCNNDKSSIGTAPNVVLLIPQEGKLPHINLLSQCNKVLTVLPHKRNLTTTKTAWSASTPGLSSQIASGIALQRLSAIFHPSLRVLENESDLQH